MPSESNNGFPNIERGQAWDASGQEHKPSHAASTWNELEDRSQPSAPVFASAGSSSVIPVQPVIPGSSRQRDARAYSVAEALHERLARVRSSVEQRIPSVEDDERDAAPAPSAPVYSPAASEFVASEPAHEFTHEPTPAPEPEPAPEPLSEHVPVIPAVEPEPAPAPAPEPEPQHAPALLPQPAPEPLPAPAPEPEPEPESAQLSHGSHFGPRVAPDPEQPEPEPVDQTQPVAYAEPSQPSQPSHFADDDDEQARLAYQQLEARRAEERKKRFIRIGIVAGVVVLGVIIWAVFFNRPAPDKTLESATVEQAYTMDFVSTVTASGTLKPNESVVVTPEVDGIIESLNVAQDQYVNEGDILLTIKNDELDQAVRSAEQQISQARNELSQANAALSAAYSSYSSKEAAASVPIKDAEGNETYPEFDEASAQAEITSAKGQVSAAELAVENAQTAYDNAVAQANKRTVYAPKSGTVVALTAQVGAPVGDSKGGLMQIADVSKMRVTVQVNEVDISNILVGQKADVTFNAVPDATLEAEVVNIASVATGMEGESGAGGNGVANFAVDLLISTPDLRLKPGMTANVAIRTVEVPGAVVVPAAAVTDNGDGTGSVERVVNEETKETETVSVRIGNKGSGVVVITEGLSAGDNVLIAGAPAASTSDAQAA